MELCELTLIDSMNDAVVNYRVVCDYYRRPKVTKQIEDDIDAYNKAFNARAGVRTMNEWCPKWVSLATHVFSLVVGGSLLIQDHSLLTLKLGTFLALLNLIKSSGENYQSLYTTYLAMTTAYLPMWRIVRFMNQPEDTGKRKAANRIRRAKGEQMRSIKRSSMSAEELKKGIPVVDLLPIQMEKLTFALDKLSAPILRDINLDLKQGTVVGIIGAQASGKGVFLEVLGSVYQYESGDIFFPPHLRVLHVCRHPQVLSGTVSDNLFFGLSAELDQEKIQRGVEICKRLKFPKRLFDLAISSADNRRRETMPTTTMLTMSNSSRK
jgi:ABC-type multidrug transport system fused ATPase/permease subunit